MGTVSKMVELGYTPHTDASTRCVGCAKAEHHVTGIRCEIGGFYVTRAGGCRRHEPVVATAPVPAPLVPIGPVDI
ncbi:MAG: hypothetical protein AB7P99_13110 [Vicinamibacterales bacterium]|uniref:hypothetical protein n=1 Tax=Ramlibacter sp. TaxID=1917967 RepID=UPI003D0B299B